MRWGHQVAGAVKIWAALAGAVALVASTTATAAEDGKPQRFNEIMDSVFGAGKWRETGGYRTPERENELRAQGALTVPPGVLSRHSMGRPGAPGAYDLVVDGVSPSQAAAKLRSAGAPFKTLFAEGAYGTQGPHLHVEPFTLDLKAAGPRPPRSVWYVENPTPAQQALILLHDRAAQGEADAQLRLGRIYAEGREAPRDLVAAFVWTALAASNAAVDPGVRGDAERGLAVLARNMRADDLAQARRFVRGPADCGGAPSGGGTILVVGADRPQPGADPAQTGAACPASTATLTRVDLPVGSRP
jgi:hypothetical protein